GAVRRHPPAAPSTPSDTGAVPPWPPVPSTRPGPEDARTPAGDPRRRDPPARCRGRSPRGNAAPGSGRVRRGHRASRPPGRAAPGRSPSRRARGWWGSPRSGLLTHTPRALPGSDSCPAPGSPPMTPAGWRSAPRIRISCNPPLTTPGARGSGRTIGDSGHLACHRMAGIRHSCGGSAKNTASDCCGRGHGRGWGENMRALSALMLLTALPAFAQEATRLVVTDLEARGATELQATAATGSVLRGLRNLNAFQVLSADEVRQLLAIERSRQLLGGEMDPGEVNAASKALGARYLVTGSVSRPEARLVVDLQLLDTEDGRVLAQKS